MTVTSLDIAQVVSLRVPSGRVTPEALVSKPSRVSWGVVVTALRAPVAVLGVWAIWMGFEPLAILAFTIFAGVDLFDGVLARRRGEETAFRRSLDVVIDRIAIHLAIAAMVIVNGFGWALPVVLLARDLSQAAFSAVVLRRYGVVVVGPHSHMLYGISMLVWGSLSFSMHRIDPFVTAGMLVLSTLILVDYFRKSRSRLRAITSGA